VLVRGKWVAKAGAVWGTEKSADQIAAALRSPLALTEGDIQYELQLPPATANTLRIQCRERAQVILVKISSRRISITDEASAVLAQTPARFKPGTWLPVRVCIRGRELSVQVAGTTVQATAPMFTEPKTAFAFMAQGEDIGFRKVRVNSVP
jgi:hypothetical protein